MECDNQSTTPNKDSTSGYEANGVQSEEHLSQHQETDNSKEIKNASRHTESSGKMEGESNLSAGTQEEQNVNTGTPEENDGLQSVTQEEQNVNSATPEGNEGRHNIPQEKQNVNTGALEESDRLHSILQAKESVTTNTENQTTSNCYLKLLKIDRRSTLINRAN